MGQKSDIWRDLEVHRATGLSLCAASAAGCGAAEIFPTWQVSEMAGVCRTFRRRASRHIIYYLIKLLFVERLIVGGLGGLLIRGLGFIKVFSLLKVLLKLVGLVLSIIPWLRL